MPANVMDKPVIKVEVISDIVCPWCYIGKRRLEKAMALAEDHYDFAVEYFPFELNPHLPPEGVDYKDYLCKKFGSEERFHQLTEHIRRTAAREELVFNLHLQKRTPNTRDIHRIIMMARDEGVQLEAVERFFHAYFTEGTDLSQKENIVRIAAEAGLNPTDIEQFLNSSTGTLEIEMAEKELHDLGITSIPLYIFNNRTTISGAQSVETFTRAFEESAMAPPAGVSASPANLRV